MPGYWGGRPHPHLIVGGSGLSGTIAPASQWADEYNTVMATPEECAVRREKLARACERAGRAPIPFSLMTACEIGRTPDEATERIRRRLERGRAARRPGRVPGEARRGCDPGDARRSGRAATCHERAGVERVMLQHLDHRELELVALLGQESAPMVA